MFELQCFCEGWCPAAGKDTDAIQACVLQALHL
jgi:hypothetical protein